MNTDTDTDDSAQGSHGSQESPFWFKFICGFLPQTIDVRNLVEVKKNGEALFIYFNDLKEISHKYWEYKRDVENKVLKDDDKSKKDNFKNTLKLLVKSGFVEVDEIVTRRKRNEPEKTCLTYEVLDEEFCTALLENYSAHMGFENGESSSDTGIETTQSDEHLPSQALPHHSPTLQIYDVADMRILTITPDRCPMRGGCSFNITADQDLESATYDVQFLDYGNCEASGSGKDYIRGLGVIPAATRAWQGKHSIPVSVFRKTPNGRRYIGYCQLQYEDEWGDLAKELFGYNPIPNNPDEFNADNSSSTSTKRSSSDATCAAGSSKRFKSSTVNMPLLLYLCDEMAKRGDEHFFRALNELGVMGKVLEKRCEHLAKTAREYGHSEFAVTIETSPRKPSHDHSLETFTVENLIDAVRKKRLFPNSDTDSNDDTNSDLSGYTGDCESEEYSDLNEKNKSANDVIMGVEEVQVEELSEPEMSVDKVIDEAEPVEDCGSVSDDGRNSCSSRSKDDCGSKEYSGPSGEKGSVDDVIIEPGVPVEELNEQEMSMDEAIKAEPVAVKYIKPFTMDSHSHQPTIVTSLYGFGENKKDKERVLHELMVASCALLNSEGGKILVRLGTFKDNPFVSSQFIRHLEQCILSVTGIQTVSSKIRFAEEGEILTVSVEPAHSLITMKYNLYLPSQTQVVEVSPLEPHENVKNDIMYRKAILNPVELGSHCQTFRIKDKNCGFHESKTCQLKNLKAGASKRTTLADRMTRKGNKFNCYVSAFANHSGGHIYYGITDDGVVEGEFIPSEKDKEEITKKVEKAINKMIWPEQIGQPKRGEQWEIFFEPVVEENSKPVPSTFVVVIYIAPCLGGVFTEEPECYEMVEEEVQKMSFATWKERISQPVGMLNSRSEKKIPEAVKRITWSSDAVRKAFTIGCDELRKIISNGSWEILEKECNTLQNEFDLRETMKLLVLFKQITVCNRRGKFKEAFQFLEEYKSLFPKVQDSFIFEMLGLYLEAALKRASGDLEALKERLTKALAMADEIEPGLVTATVYIFAATVSDLINLESPVVLTARALEHLECVQDFSDVLAAMRRKANIILAASHLGCNVKGELLKDSIDLLGLEKAKSCIKAITESACEEHRPLSVYFDIQLNLVLSIFKYRHSQLYPDQKNRDLDDACSYTKKAQSLAEKYEFMEMAEWSKNNEALCLEELTRTKTPVPKHENDGRACGSDVTHKSKSHGRNAMSLNSDDPNVEGNSQRNVRPLEHFECVSDFSNDVADKKRRENITSASHRLGFKICGQPIHDSIDISSLKEAKRLINAIYKSGYKDHPLSVYCDIQLNLVLSMFNYRHSQLYPDKSNSYFRDARSCIEKAQGLAGKYEFTKLIEWSKNIEEELDRPKTPVQNHGNDDRPHSTSSPRHVTQDAESQDTSAKSQSSDKPNVEEKSQQTKAVKQAQLQSDHVSPSGPQKQRIDMSKFLSAKPFQPRTTSSLEEIHDARGASALERNVSFSGHHFAGYSYRCPVPRYPVDTSLPCQPLALMDNAAPMMRQPDSYRMHQPIPINNPAFSRFPLHPQPQHQQQVCEFQSYIIPVLTTEQTSTEGEIRNGGRNNQEDTRTRKGTA